MIALLTVLEVTVTGCTKEDVADNMGIVATIHSVTYIVDGQQYYANPQTDGEWSEFLDRMFALAEEGRTVHFWRCDVQASSKKEKLTYTTTSLADAKAWCKQKADEGYNVAMTYDQQTGKYTCNAVR